MTQSTISLQDTPWKIRFLLFGLVAAILIVLNWEPVSRVNHELGDFAANGLMIAKAKSSILLDGNYSRVGFYHPGPAILYVLAAGEIILHDWLHLVPSAFSGQLVAVSLYNAAWLVTMFVLARRMTASCTSATLIMGGFALALALFDRAIFNGPWMPHLYCLPFATMLVAGGRLTDGYADSLMPLAFACGFLINGHVSFMSTLCVIFLVVVVVSLLRTRQREPFLLSKKFIGTHWRAMLTFVGVLAVFLLPLLALTVFRFPGPLQTYVKFGAHNKANSLYQAFVFMRVYWGGTATASGAGAALCAMLWTYAQANNDAFGRAVRALLIMMLAATLALLFYAKFGVDMLDQNYIGLFYSTVPALAVGLAVAATARVLPAHGNSVLAKGFGLLLMGGAALLVREPPGYASEYNEAGVVDFYRSMKAIPQPVGRMVIDQDWSEDQGYLWGKMLGLQIYALREHDPFFCFGKNWSFANTWQAECTPAEVAIGHHYEVRKGVHEGSPVAQGLGLFVYDRHFSGLTAAGGASVAVPISAVQVQSRRLKEN